MFFVKYDSNPNSFVKFMEEKGYVTIIADNIKYATAFEASADAQDAIDNIRVNYIGTDPGTWEIVAGLLEMDSDETLTSDSDFKGVTQAAIKAYVDAAAGGGGSSSSGTYVPTITLYNSLQTTVGSVFTFYWSKVGNIVSVSGYCTFNKTAGIETYYNAIISTPETRSDGAWETANGAVIQQGDGSDPSICCAIEGYDADSVFVFKCPITTGPNKYTHIHFTFQSLV